MPKHRLARVIYALGAAMILSLGDRLVSGDSIMERFPLLAGILWVLDVGLLLYEGYYGQG